jgi:uncharacterized membrane protein
MEIDFYAWISLSIRWLHIITGIAWIGSSFYFVWLDNHLTKPEDGEGGDGELWSVHGGGFYHNKKYMTAPDDMPEHLHWFKYEAYFTWISGFLLLGVIYYYGANLYLIDKSKFAFTSWQAIAASLGMLAGGWLVYDFLCRSGLRHKPKLFGLVLFGAITLAAYFSDKLFSDRAAYIQIGAMIGTMMAGNVFFVIIPNQKIVVADLLAGRPVDPALGKAAKLRSVHNNYMTLPVLFIMVSNHYPMTYAGPYNWATLALVSAAGVSIRHFFNIRHKSNIKDVYIFIAGGLMLVAMVFPLSIKKPKIENIDNFSMNEVRTIVQKHCTACHSANPSHESFDEPQGGLLLDSDQRIKLAAERILERAVIAGDMPLANETDMTVSEREVLRLWIEAGAPLTGD